MSNRPQTEIQNWSHPAPSLNTSPTDDKANYDDLFDEYAADYNKNQSHQAFAIAHPSTQHRRVPSFPANQSQSSLSHKPLWDYPPSSSESTAEKEPSRPFWQKVSFTLKAHTISPNQTSIPDPPGLAILSTLCTDRRHSDCH